MTSTLTSDASCRQSRLSIFSRLARPIVVVAIGLVALSLASCAPPDEAPTDAPGHGELVGAVPSPAAYIVAGQNVAGGFARNALIGLDDTAMEDLWTIPLPHSMVGSLARDPRGRLWIGYSGDFAGSDDRVQILDGRGGLLETLHPGIDPEAGISFAAGRAFVACAGNGFSGTLAVIDLESLTVEATVPLALEPNPYLLIASAANQEAVVVTGLTSGPQDACYCVVSLIDPRSLEVKHTIPLGMHSDVWCVLPGESGEFYLLNAASARETHGGPTRDLFVLSPDSPPRVRTQTLASHSPVWGDIEGGVLWTYHNPTWNSTFSSPLRHLGRFELASGNSADWRLPSRWNVSCLAVLESKILLARWDHRDDDSQDGLFRFDPIDGTVSLELVVPDASHILPSR